MLTTAPSYAWSWPRPCSLSLSGAQETLGPSDGITLFLKSSSLAIKGVLFGKDGGILRCLGLVDNHCECLSDTITSQWMYQSRQLSQDRSKQLHQLNKTQATMSKSLHSKSISTLQTYLSTDGCTKCVFCEDEESIQHLFFECPLARLLWRTVNFTYDLSPPTNTTNIFGNWLNGVDRHLKL
jgi:hypothetical protein